MTRVALIADTHIPSRAREIPDWVTDVLSTADHTIHAGDFDTPQGHFEVSVAAGGELTAVVGNKDHSMDIPTVATHEADGVRFVVTHGNGPKWQDDYHSHLAALAAEHEAHVAVAGHTHRVTDVVHGETRVLNPGSATAADPAEQPTLMTVDCNHGSYDVTLHEPP
jgi:putative phosphoesterase